MRYLLPLLGFYILSCSYVSSTDKEREIATNAILFSALTTSTPTVTSTECNVSAPTFSTLSTAGFNTSCGRSGCHDGTTRYNATNYAQVKALTNPGNASTSSLYIQVKGSMAIYSNATLDRAIYCWIQGGSNP
ncbi:hypothetical protein EHQ58_13890 [Leptospira ognonensis]|uniref:Cytochrome C Planctomycete-type domain-containing protein n=1 Tax=Leptospira ognonensis TaxID=2484945 RepID=A0A4R9K045_9LEPT|nr:hypothetical protein [Leptospira ognonensis]TGL57379.1 hypothetical protein EHQ58_13890 [Leptospira ognonensis]